ncbi:hypothetical protein MT488_17005 [Enterobacter ludwigii]|jgi:hypothetical protein|uniref:hypothetical protein n=1 Tax=Enterobacteriaceae TaxID=543 RepID=UPI001FBBC7A9|nr:MULTISPECIES: hypothetical protein [Enterobacteriaceae]MDK1186673.1 hypothetical protein [Cronobacter turicensis]MDK1206052.1 hypothetical protein [Cronobacter turicensis]MDK1213175.1 hypothetical protein [Cronobacter turicensis]MDK1217772.1 hypothetical protein [Cronobacter turicensis]MDK1230649.1 hypothetical protein [Cronobacter turicensis]
MEFFLLLVIGWGVPVNFINFKNFAKASGITNSKGRLMATKEIPIDKVKLATQLRTRGLVQTVADGGYRRLDESHSALIETLATILNATDAPPIDLHIEEALSELKGPRFFLVQHFLCDLIPHLNLDQDVLLDFITRLLDAGGNDLAAGAPSTAFGEWTKKNPIRSSKVYEAVHAGDNLALRQLFTVLVMNAEIEKGIIFAQAQEREAKLAALSALGAMELGERYGEVLDILLQAASSDDEDIALRSLEAGYRAAAQRKIVAPVGFDEQLDRILQTRSPFSIHLAVDLLWLHRVGLTENAINLCLDAAADVDSDNVGTISHLSHAAYQLVSDGHAEKVICLLTELFERSGGRITLDAFEGTYHALQNAGSEVLGNAVVYWLLNGSMHTHKCVASEVCGVGNDDPPFSISASSLPMEPSEQLYLCRKAVGWFFIDPVVAAVIPLAVLRDGSSDIKNDVLDLIYHPLLVSYGGKLKDYLECYAESIPDLAGLLTRKLAFQDAMEGIERLVELHPSEMQRETAHIQWHEQMERGIEQGRRKSVFEDIFPKQYILYGRSSLTPIHTGQGGTHLTETAMHSFSISSEYPILDIVDPVGLEHMLLHFKLEQRGKR